MTIQFEKEVEAEFSFDWEEVLTEVVKTSVETVKCPYEIEVNILLTDNERIQEINAEFRQMDKPTDVLSFPMVDYESPADFSLCERYKEGYFHPETKELMLGDIVLSKDKVFSQAKEYGHSVKREIAFLTAHSMLHLFGYDHMEEPERIEMENVQQEIMNKLQIFR